MGVNRLVVTNGMIVQLSSNVRYMVLDDILININESIPYTNETELDIIKVYARPKSLGDIYNEDKLEVVWEKLWKPKYGDAYFRPKLTGACKYEKITWEDSIDDWRIYQRGLVCSTKDEAIKKCNKLIEFSKEVDRYEWKE